MPKKIRTNVTSTPVLQPLLVTSNALDAQLTPFKERATQRNAPMQAFSTHRRVTPQRITSFAQRRRNK